MLVLFIIFLAFFLSLNMLSLTIRSRTYQLLAGKNKAKPFDCRFDPQLSSRCPFKVQFLGAGIRSLFGKVLRAKEFKRIFVSFPAKELLNTIGKWLADGRDPSPTITIDKTPDNYVVETMGKHPLLFSLREEGL